MARVQTIDSMARRIHRIVSLHANLAATCMRAQAQGRQSVSRYRRFFWNLYSRPTEMAKLMSVCVILLP